MYEWEANGRTCIGPSVSAVLYRCPSVHQYEAPDRDWVDMPKREMAIYRRHRGTLAHYFALDWLAGLVEDERLELDESELEAHEELQYSDDLVDAAERLWVARRQRMLGDQGWHESDVPGWLQGQLEPDDVLDIGIETEGWTGTCYQDQWLLMDCVEEIRLNALPNFRAAVAEELGGILTIDGIEAFVFTTGHKYGGQYDLMFSRVVDGGETEYEPRDRDYFSPPEREFDLQSERILVELTFSPISFAENDGRPVRRKMLQLVALARACNRDVHRLCVVRCSPLDYPDYEIGWLEDTIWTREELFDEFRRAADYLRNDLVF